MISLGVQREICRRIAAGEFVSKICEDEDMPNKHELYNLMWRDPNFKRMYKDARTARMEMVAEELQEVAAKAKDLDKVVEKKSMAHVQAIRLEVDTNKWLLSKLLADEYADELPEQRRGKAIGDVLEVIREVSKLAKPEPKVVKATVIETPQLKDA